jgi:hypothetical protein
MDSSGLYIVPSLQEGKICRIPSFLRRREGVAGYSAVEMELSVLVKCAFSFPSHT